MAEPQVFVRVIHGEEKGKVWDLQPQNVYVLGRSHTCNLPLLDRTVSGTHARLTCEQGIWFITDLESTHGTHLNEQRILAETPLFDRDQIRLGKTRLEFREYVQLAPEDLSEIGRGVQIAD
jgi:pSer/pThr/pTyr-binding forkhead associated (FHA) protein